MRVYKRGQSWYLDICQEGRRTRRQIPGARTKTEAHAALSATKADLLRGEFNFKREKKILFGDFASFYVERHSKPNKKSWKRDIVSLNALLPCFKETPLSKISPFSIEGYKLKRKERVTVSTVNRELALLKNMFTRAIDWGFALSNPVRKVKLYSEENRKRERILTNEEISKFLLNSSSPLREFVLIAINTGMRSGEILALKWEDIDFRNDYVIVRQSKSGRSRKVPLNVVSKQAFEVLKHSNGSTDYVFFNPSTGRSIRSLKTAFKTACRKAGIHDLRIHDFRHYAASRMVQAGIDLHTVSKILGHSSIMLTMRYSHPGFDHTREAIKALERDYTSMDRIREKDGTDMAQRVEKLHIINFKSNR
jgi:integrase